MTRWTRHAVGMLDHPILNVGPYDRRSAWQWLIDNAAWKDKRVNHKGKPLELKRGQVLVGRAFLAEKWGWSEQTVRTFIHLLVAENMVILNQSNGHFANVLTISNYEKYQTADAESRPEDQPESNQSLTSAQPEPNQTLTISTKDIDSGSNEPECTSPTTSCANDDGTPEANVHRKPAEPLPIIQAFEAYLNVAAMHGLAQPRTLTPAMRKAIGARLREHTVGGWQDMLDGLAASDFLKGKNDRGWRANLDWIVKPANFSKIVSGNYDNRESTEFRYGQSPAKHPLLSALDDLTDRLASVN